MDCVVKSTEGMSEVRGLRQEILKRKKRVGHMAVALLVILGLGNGIGEVG